MGINLYTSQLLSDGAQLSHQILTELEASEIFCEYSHPIRGRWENTYLSFTHTPTTRLLLNQLIAQIELTWELDRLFCIHDAGNALENSFWFNIAPPGASTAEHRHSERAVISGVFYLQADAAAGDLYLRDSGENVYRVTPEIGRWVSFEPWVRHGVLENHSPRERISLAFNLYRSSVSTP